MLNVAEVLFWASIFIIIYTYAGYPLLLLVLTSIKKIFSNKLDAGSAPQAVSLVITAYNEEKILGEKIDNTLQLNYPAELLQVIFVTDGSNDKTPELVKQHPRFELLHGPERKGKLAAMNRAVEIVKSPVIIFSDANGFLNPDCISLLVRHYSDPRIGGVTGEKRIIKSGAVGKGEGLYWKYESALKKLDSDLNTVVGAAGELFSVRTSLYAQIPGEIVLEDFVQSLLLCRKGYKVKYEPKAYSAETASLIVEDEMERKIRISAGAFQAIVFLKSLFNFFKHPLLTFQYISHRVLRWTVAPVALIILFIITFVLYSLTKHRLYGVFGLGQALFYVLAIIGWYFARNNRKHPVFYLPFYFCFMNFCVFAGFVRYLSGSQDVIWKKAERK